MSNVYYGTATFVAPRETLEHLYKLLSRLDECAAVSGFGGSEEWIGHIFKERVVTEGVFCTGCALGRGGLEVYLRCVGEPGFDTLQSIADSTATIIRYTCKDEVDDPLRPQSFMARVSDRAQWELRELSELDAAPKPTTGEMLDDGFLGSSSSRSKGISSMNLH